MDGHQQRGPREEVAEDGEGPEGHERALGGIRRDVEFILLATELLGGLHEGVSGSDCRLEARSG